MARDDDRRNVDSAGATLARDIEKTWRNWKAFLAEQMDELAAQQADESPEADLTGAGRPAARKARLDAATRQQFGGVLEARRQQAQAKAEKDAREAGRPAPDADQIYAALLQHILDELDGKIHPSGMALVWYKDALIKFDAASVSAGMTDADYLAAGAGSGPTKQQALLLLGLLAVMGVVLVFAIPFFFGSSSSSAAASQGSTARVAQQNTPLWTVDTAAVGALSVPVQIKGIYPPVLCVDDKVAKAATPGATVVLTSTQAVRRYQVQPNAANTPDLVLAACNGSTTTPKAAAQLTLTHTRTMLDSEVLHAVTVRGPDLDPQAIPANQMEVTVDVVIPDASGGTLILADGRRWSATRSEPTDGGTRLTYLVPLAQSTQPAGWELPNGSDLPDLLAITLPAPTSRAALLRRVLDVQAGQPSVALRDGEPELQVSLSVTLKADAAPMTLLADDLVALSNGSPLSARWDAPQLTPGKPVTIAVRVPLRDRDTLELALATWRVRVNTNE